MFSTVSLRFVLNRVCVFLYSLGPMCSSWLATKYSIGPRLPTEYSRTLDGVPFPASVLHARPLSRLRQRNILQCLNRVLVEARKNYLDHACINSSSILAFKPCDVYVKTAQGETFGKFLLLFRCKIVCH